MKLPENPTKNVRVIISNILKCPGYSLLPVNRMSEKDLYEIKKLCDCLDTVIATMKLHAGDCCSLNNEVDLFRGHWEDAEEENKRLNKIIEDIEDWGVVSCDGGLLKLIKSLRAGESR